jgi:hypothetical protein
MITVYPKNFHSFSVKNAIKNKIRVNKKKMAAYTKPVRVSVGLHMRM